MNEPKGKDWMDQLKEGNCETTQGSGYEKKSENAGQNGGAIDPGRFQGTFKFSIGEKVYSRIHECKGLVEYSEMTRYITGDQISYKVRFNDPEDVKTEISAIDEAWLDKV